MIVFSQPPTHHSRLGNSLVWMHRVKSYMEALGERGVFPWAPEHFSKYLAPDSYWMRRSVEAERLFAEAFGLELSTLNASKACVETTRKHAATHGPDAVRGGVVMISDPEKSVLYLKGQVDLSAPEIGAAIHAHALTICDEPFRFLYDASRGYSKDDFLSIAPRDDLFHEQLEHVRAVSGERENIALHIRRGDYSRWQGGAHFHPDEFWVELAGKLANEDRKLWVFSDELGEDLGVALKQKGAVLSHGAFETDFVRLMCMNSIYGPPSSFTAMAWRIATHVFDKPVTLNRLPARV